MKTNNFQDTIKAHLDQRAKEDSLFAATYTKENKNIEECYAYITNQAKKKAINGCAAISDEVVFGWAVHYYDEDNIKIEKATPSRVAASTPTPKKVEAPKAKLKPKKEDVGQLSLF